MGALQNPDHERFCVALDKRLAAGEKKTPARTAAYVETIYDGPSLDGADAARLKTVADNARKLANLKAVKARLIEMADFRAKLSGIDSSFGMVELKGLLEEVKAFNLDDYMTPAIEGAPRFYDIGRASREQIGRLHEMTIEEDIVEAGEETMRKTRKIKLGGPKKAPEAVAILALMARIGGWEAPKKLDHTLRATNTMTDDELAYIAAGGRGGALAAPRDS